MSERELYERRQAAEWAVNGPPDRGAGTLTTQLPQGWPKEGLPVSLPIQHFSPAGSFPVDESADATIYSVTGTATLISYAIPLNQVLRITAIGIDADDDGALAVLRWSAYSNGIIIPGLGNQVSGFGSCAYPVPVNVSVPGKSAFTIVGTNPINLFDWTFTIRLIGYLFTATTR